MQRADIGNSTGWGLVQRTVDPLLPDFQFCCHQLTRLHVHIIHNCSQVHSPWLEGIVDSGIGLSYRPASLCSLADRYDNPLPELTLSPHSGTMNLDTDLWYTSPLTRSFSLKRFLLKISNDDISSSLWLLIACSMRHAQVFKRSNLSMAKKKGFSWY